MKQISKTLCSLILLTLCLLPTHSDAGNKGQIAIKEIKVSKNLSSKNTTYLDTNLIYKELEAAIQSTRKLTVVTRDKEVLDAIREEQNFSQSGASAGDAAFEGQLKNAAYLCFPEILKFSLYRQLRDVPNLAGKYKRSDRGSIKMHIELVDTTTGEKFPPIKIDKSFSTPEQLTSSNSKAPNTSGSLTLAKSAARQAADAIVDTLYPMKVIKISGTKIWFNRGNDGSLEKNMILNLYSPGESLIDPDTGDDLGTAEEYIGQVKVERVNPKFSIGVLTKSDLANMVSKGFILRKPN